MARTKVPVAQSVSPVPKGKDISLAKQGATLAKASFPFGKQKPKKNPYNA